MNAFSQIPQPESDAQPGSYIPLIFVNSIYGPDMRTDIRDRLAVIMASFDIGMPRLHAEITQTVSANNKRIRKPPHQNSGLYVDQLSVKNLYHFFEGRRSEDARVQILDAYLQIAEEDPPASHLMI